MSVVGGQAKLGSLTLTLLKLDNVTAVFPDWQLQDYHVETQMLTNYRLTNIAMSFDQLAEFLRRDKPNNHFYVTNIEIVVRKIAPFTLHHSTHKKKVCLHKKFS